MIRQIVAAERRGRSTTITLACSHQRSLGGHVLRDLEGNEHVLTPNQMIGELYDCREHMCGRIVQS